MSRKSSRRKTRNPRSASTKAQLDKRMWIRIKPNASASYPANRDYQKAIEALRGQVVEVETDRLFDDQYNTVPIPGISDNGLRIMQEHVAEVINDQRRGKVKSRWSARMSTAHAAERGALDADIAPWEAHMAKHGRPGRTAGKHYKALRVTAPFGRARSMGRWTDGGTIKRVYKNGNVLLSTGERLHGVARRAASSFPIGARIYVSPEGDGYVVSRRPGNRDQPEALPRVRVLRDGRSLSGGRAYDLEVFYPRQAAKVYGHRYASMSDTQLAHAARKHLLG